MIYNHKLLSAMNFDDTTMTMWKSMVEVTEGDGGGDALDDVVECDHLEWIVSTSAIRLCQ